MRKTIYALAVISIITVLMVAVSYVQPIHRTTYGLGNGSFQAAPSFGPRPPPLKNSGVNVTLVGVIGWSTVAPACSISNPPCTIVDTPIYYVIINGMNYRLILSNSTAPPEVLGYRVIVTGLFVTPSAFDTSQWTPSIVFNGDIYVQSITYFHMYL